MNAPTLLRTLFLAAGCIAAVPAFAQAKPAIEIAPGWRPPALVVQGADQPVRLRTLKVDVEVAAGVAETRVQMEFYNPNSRVLEGRLQFPLGAGQVVSGFALDVDGQLRDAVPVEKARAEQVFEDITRRRADPGLLQTTSGNNYELRIYPLLPGKTRTVLLKLVEPAAQRLTCRSATPIASSSWTFAALRERHHPADAGQRQRDRSRVRARSPRRLHCPGLARQRGVAARSARDRGRQPRPPAGDRRARQRNLLRPRSSDRRRRGAATLAAAGADHLDASGSGANRQLDRELALLDAYFRKAQTIAVSLVRVADVASAPERFSVHGGDWSALRRALQATVYDGASNLGAVRHDGVSGEAIWFSDGLANYGAPWRIAFPVPVYAVNSAASSDPAALNALAESSGGRSIDLVASTREQATAALLTRGTQLIDVAAVGARDVVVESHHALAGRLAIAGILTSRDAELTLHLRGSDGKATTRTLRIDSRQNASHLAALQWARLSLAALAGESRTHKMRIREIGRRFGIATGETSLIVLERVEDYVQNGIEPPAVLREAYDRIAATAEQNRTRSDAARLAQVVQRFEAHVAWWNREFPKDTPEPPLEVAKSQVRGGLATANEARRERQSADAVTSASPRPAAAPMPLTASSSRFAAQAGAATGCREERCGSFVERQQHLDRAQAGRRQCEWPPGAWRRRTDDGWQSTSTSGAPTR